MMSAAIPLRDIFAGLAFHAVLSREGTPLAAEHLADHAATAREAADALIAELARKPDAEVVDERAFLEAEVGQLDRMLARLRPNDGFTPLTRLSLETRRKQVEEELSRLPERHDTKPSPPSLDVGRFVGVAIAAGLAKESTPPTARGCTHGHFDCNMCDWRLGFPSEELLLARVLRERDAARVVERATSDYFSPPDVEQTRGPLRRCGDDGCGCGGASK